MNSEQRVQRSITHTWEVPTRAGGGPHLKVGHVLPPGYWEDFDPFLMLAEDWFQQGTFDFHPHRGIETVTYVIEGKLKHEDNHGGVGVLEPGDVQWMTAGRGVIHSEDPLPGETVHSLQLWVNLPRDHKMTEPRYQDLKAAQMPLRKEEGAEIRVFSGESGGVKADTLNHVPVTYVELFLEPGATVAQDLPGHFRGFVYVLEGEGTFGAEQTPGKPNQVLWIETVEGADDPSTVTEITVHATKKMRALLIAGAPLNEPVVARGPFVMNTQEEIKQAFDDYYAGNFAK